MSTITSSTLTDIVAGDWSEAARRGFPAEVDGHWSGGVTFTTDRETLDLIVADQERFIAELTEEYKNDQDRLVFEGETLVHTSGDDPDFRQEYEPSRYENGRVLYHFLGFGWTWGELKGGFNRLALNVAIISGLEENAQGHPVCEKCERADDLTLWAFDGEWSEADMAKCSGCGWDVCEEPFPITVEQQSAIDESLKAGNAHPDIKDYEVEGFDEELASGFNVAVRFGYTYKDNGARGLEISVFAPDGECIDSQDFG